MIVPLSADTGWPPWLALFLWGGAVGGLYTLAVVEAGRGIDDGRLGMALTAIATAYTIGGIAGPAASGAVMDYMSVHGLMIAAAAAASALLILMPFLGRRTTAPVPQPPSRP